MLLNPQLQNLLMLIGGLLAIVAFLSRFRREIREDVREMRGDLKADVATLRGDFKELRVELKGDVATLRGDFKELRQEMHELARDVRQVELTLARLDVSAPTTRAVESPAA